MLVGVTGLEPATSRPPAVRATNCATPRYEVYYSKLLAATLLIWAIVGQKNLFFLLCFF